MKTEIFASLTLDARNPEHAGLRLIEWAAVCGATGVIIPEANVSLAAELTKAAAAKGLRCYVELSASNSALPKADGYAVRDPDTVNEARIAKLVRLNVPILLGISRDAKLDSDRWRQVLKGNRIIILYQNDQQRGWRPILGRLKKDFQVGYADQQHDPDYALQGCVDAAIDDVKVIVRGLTLNRSLGGLAHQTSAYPHEFGAMVESIRWAAGRMNSLRAELADLRYCGNLVARRDLEKGRLLKAEDLVQSKEEGAGISSSLLERLAGVQLCYERKAYEPITFGMIEPLSGCSQEEPLDISVVIRAKNEAAWLRRSIPALLNQQRPPKEIVIVDNDSTDGSVEYVEKLSETHPVRFGIVRISEKEFSYGRALNWGIAKTTAPWVISLSAHCIPLHDRWLSAYAVECGQRFAAAVYGKQEPLPDSHDFDKRDLWTTFGQERVVQHGEDYFFHNANSMINKAVWEKIPFDEQINGVEDRDWAKKILADGYQIVYNPLSSVHHYHGIHQGRNEARAKRVARVIEVIRQQRHGAQVTK